jgi:hypothetical protein
MWPKLMTRLGLLPALRQRGRARKLLVEHTIGTQPLELWLEDSQNAKISWSQKNLLVPIRRYGRLDGLVAKVRSLAKRTTRREWNFEFKVS